MATFLRGLFAAVVVMAAFYGLGAFIAWDANPGQWNPGFRSLIGGVSLFFSTAAWCITAGEIV